MPPFCRSCFVYGHSREECTVNIRCRNCGSHEHFARECAQPRRCDFCGKPGHLARECTEKGGRKIFLSYADIASGRSAGPQEEEGEVDMEEMAEGAEPTGPVDVDDDVGPLEVAEPLEQRPAKVSRKEGEKTGCSETEKALGLMESALASIGPPPHMEDAEEGDGQEAGPMKEKKEGRGRIKIPLTEDEKKIGVDPLLIAELSDSDECDDAGEEINPVTGVGAGDEEGAEKKMWGDEMEEQLPLEEDSQLPAGQEAFKEVRRRRGTGRGGGGRGGMRTPESASSKSSPKDLGVKKAPARGKTGAMVARQVALAMGQQSLATPINQRRLAASASSAKTAGTGRGNIPAWRGRSSSSSSSL